MSSFLAFLSAVSPTTAVPIEPKLSISSERPKSCIPISFTLPWWLRQHVPPKRWYPPGKQHGAKTLQPKSAFFKTACRISEAAYANAVLRPKNVYKKPQMRGKKQPIFYTRLFLLLVFICTKSILNSMKQFSNAIKETQHISLLNYKKKPACFHSKYRIIIRDASHNWVHKLLRINDNEVK
jgi:hypothetical protein